jgi:hypothetical protein
MTIEREAAKPKRPRDLEFEDAPRQESIRGLSPRTIKRNPSADQKRVRREMQRKTASQESPLADALIKAASDSPFGDWSCATPGCDKYDGMSAFRGDKYCKSCMKAGEPDKQRDAQQAKKRSSKKTASKCETCGNTNFTEGGSCTRCGRSKTASLQYLKCDKDGCDKNASQTRRRPKDSKLVGLCLDHLKQGDAEGYEKVSSKTAGRPGTCENCGSENVVLQGYHAPTGTGPGGRGRMGDPGGGSKTQCKECGHETDHPYKDDSGWRNASKTATLPLPVDVPTPERKPELGDHKCQQCDYSGAPVLSQAGGYSCRNCGSYAINKVKVPKTAGDYAGRPWDKAEHFCSKHAPSYTKVAEPTAENPCQTCGGVGWKGEGGKESSLQVEAKGIAGLEGGDEVRYSHPDHPDYEFKVTYHPRDAIGDNGQPARGYVKGGFEVTYPNGKTKYHDHGPFRPGKDMNSKAMVAQSIESDIIGKIHRNHLQSKRYGDREASLQTVSTQFDTQADKLNPGDMIRTPTGQSVKVLRMRNHETSPGHVYMDTDQGTSVVRRKSPVQVVPFNSQQQQLPGYGTPGGNTNSLPMEKGDSQHGPGGSNAISPGDNDCPVCGGKGTLHRQGSNYVCSKCGYRENVGGAGQAPNSFNFTDMPQQLRGTSSLKSAIARRAQEVLEATKEIQ